jgi:hypothetical protein
MLTKPRATVKRGPAVRSSRRHFLQSAVAGVALPYLVPQGVLAVAGKPGANERVTIGVIGTGSRVSAVLANDSPPGQMRLAALSDCNLPRITAFVQAVQGSQPEAAKCARYQDYRELLDKEKLDGVYVATTTHARALVCIHALQAGLDVYAEKPITLTIDEGQALVRAVRKYKRIFQAGTQARSMPVNRWAVGLLQRGAIGKITKVQVPNFDAPREYKPRAQARPAPAGLNWDQWCNQAPLFPCDPSLLKDLYTWAPLRPFDGNGTIWGVTGFGTHAYDQIQWAIQKDHTSPVDIWPTKPGDLASPVHMRYADGLLLEMLEQPHKGPAFGGIFHGENGKVEINRGEAHSNPPAITPKRPAHKDLFPGKSTAWHVQNWLDSIRSRAEPHCPVEAAHRHTVLCHLVNVARDLGRKLKYDPETDRFVGDEEANRHPSVTRPRRKGYELPS